MGAKKLRRTWQGVIPALTWGDISLERDVLPRFVCYRKHVVNAGCTHCYDDQSDREPLSP